MSRLADLIAQLCPDGVEYKLLSECVVLPSIPRGLKRGQYESSGTYPIVDQGRGPVAGYSSDETKLVKDIPGIVFGDHTREIKYVDHFFVPGADGVKWIRAVDDVDIRYLFHSLSSLAIPSRGYNRHWNVVREMSIPVPPLEVQREIVRILDQFTTLEAELETELEAELEARRAQYEYYRNQLLSYDALASRGPVEWVKLKDIVSMRAGSSITSKDIATVADSSHVYPCYGANGIRGYVSAVTNRDNASIIGRQGALSGNISFAEAPFFATEHAVVVTPKVKLVLRWLYHTLIVAELSKYVTKSAQPGLSVRRLEQVEVLFPSIEEQQRIADILDRFDALVNDISSGLPAEIAARRAQYEYYRDRLLSFPEKK